MINSLTIEHYRAFQKFELNGLTRVNLFVGKNNSGKTSAIEALYLLATNSDPQALWKICSNRGEMRFTDPVPGRPMYPELELSHLFNGHTVNLGATLRISATNNSPTRISELTIVEAKMEDNPQLFMMTANEIPETVGARLALSVKGVSDSFVIPLTQRGTIRHDAINFLTNIRTAQPSNVSQSQLINAQYVSNASLTSQDLNTMWGGIVLTPDEDWVMKALQSLDGNIERIAAINSPIFNQQQRGGFAVKMKNVDQPIPIGSLGDGAWRMLALAIALIRSKNGIMLIDEIDTGFHYSVMISMWRMIVEISKMFNIQIFATTHSNDCIRALASLAENEMCIHRIEPQKEQSVQYSAEEVRAAAEHSIEVR